MELIRTHPYLFANLPVLFLLLFALMFTRSCVYRKLAWLSGLFCVPGSAAALLHNEHYWNPARLGGGSFGVEDVVFTFVSGALVWMLAAFPFRRSLDANFKTSSWAIRLAVACSAFAGLSGGLWIAGLEGLGNTLTAGCVALAVILVLRRDLLALAVPGILLFVPVYCFIVKIQFALWPGYILQWHSGGPLAASFIGLPVGELIFAALFGAGWPVYIAYLFNLNIQSGSDS